MARRLLVEVAEDRSPEELAEVAGRAMKLMRAGSVAEGEGMLLMSKAFTKFYRFLWGDGGPYVELEWVFDTSTVEVERFVESSRAVGIAAYRRSRRCGGRACPSAVVDAEAFISLKMLFGVPPSPLEIVALRYLMCRDEDEAYGMLAALILASSGDGE